MTVDEYLHTSFEHDAEYVDGRVVYRPDPIMPHSRMQGYLGYALYEVARARGYKVWLEQLVRTQRDPPRFRVPDVCLTLGKPDEEIFTTPPFLCAEILSPEDKAVALRAKVDEYLRFGVRYVWVIDPESLAGEVYMSEGIVRVDEGVFRADQIEVDIREACS